METALWTAQVLLAAIFLATSATKLTQPRARLAAGPMGWAADVRDVEFRAVGLRSRFSGRWGWFCREHWGSRRFSPRSPRWDWR